MALMPTGLGWYADENWLRQSAGKMGEVDNTISYPDPSDQSPYSGELSILPSQSPGFCLSKDPPGYEWRFFQMNKLGTATSVVFISSVDLAPIFVASESGVTIHYGTVPGGASLTPSTYDSDTGLYYSQPWTHDNQYDFAPNFIVNSVEEALSKAKTLLHTGGGIDSFYKLNSGYAVPVIVKWTPWNTETPQISPVLISSVEPNTTLSLDGTSAISSALNTNAIDSKVFYMRYYLGNITEGNVTATGAQYVDFSTSHGPMTADMLFTLLARMASIGVGDVPSHVDPYSPGGTTEPSVPSGTYTIVTDPVPIPPLPDYGLSDAGFFSIWIPTQLEISSLAKFMWNGEIWSIDFWKRMVLAPTDFILGLSILPFVITPEGTARMSLGYISTGIDMHYTDEQFHELDFGTIDVDEVWGAYIDYNPYTSVEIFLPYIGTRRLNTDEVMGKTLHLVYKVDIVSGACVAIISVDGTVMYQFIGNCSTQIPVTAEQMINLVRNVTNLITGGVSMISPSSSASNDSGGEPSLAHKAAAAGVVSSALNIATTKQAAEHTGNVSSAAGLLGVQKPYLIMHIPNLALPEEQNTYTGYPSFITELLGDLSGYTEIEQIHLMNIPCTEKEMEEIDSALRNGVIF